MRKIPFTICFLLSALTYGQELKIPMKAAYWEYDSTKVEFITHRSVPAISGVDGAYYHVFLKDQVFTNGTIEFDVELVGMGFPGILFRLSEDRKNGENFYIRSFGEVSPFQRTTIQYATVIDGTSLWDLTDEYQSGAVIYQEGWNHVKLVISDEQMRAYVNDMKKPALIVPKLEGVMKSGGVSLSGNVIYANFLIKPNVTEGLASEAGYTSSDNDSRYMRSWRVSESVDFPFGRDIIMPLPSMYGTLDNSELPDGTTKWTPIKAESRALINLTRKFGSVENDGRRLAWLKTTIHSNSAQERTMHLGFSDEAWVFLNGKILYIDKNYYGTPSQKEPRGRCTIENASIKLPLNEGDNEIMIGLANYFYGWGIIARLDQMNGITLKK